MLLLLSSFVTGASPVIIAKGTLQMLISATHTSHLTPRLGCLTRFKHIWLQNPFIFPLHKPALIGKHFSGFTLYSTILLNSLIICSKLMFLNIVICDYAICTNFCFYFFYFSCNVSLGDILILLNFTFLVYMNKMGIIGLLESQVYWKN